MIRIEPLLDLKIYQFHGKNWKSTGESAYSFVGPLDAPGVGEEVKSWVIECIKNANSGPWKKDFWEVEGHRVSVAVSRSANGLNRTGVLFTCQNQGTFLVIQKKVRGKWVDALKYVVEPLRNETGDELYAIDSGDELIQVLAKDKTTGRFYCTDDKGNKI